ncbi:MAG: MFS transporter, partial [Betaproteobacteria bacterium]
VGLIANLLVKPVKESVYMNEAELARERALQHEGQLAAGQAETAARGRFGMSGALAWAAVGIPFGIGLCIALQKAAGLF